MEEQSTYRSMDTEAVDLRLQSLRQRDQAAERCLLESIRMQGIREPLLVAAQDSGDRAILLDGFKRYRCARRLSIGVVTVRSVAADERSGLLRLLRESRGKGLADLEYAAIIDVLVRMHGMNLTQIASHLGCSVAWVSLRQGLLRSMSPAVLKAVLEGRFPPRCYMYALRPFTRVKGIGASEVERFVLAVSGRKLSTRAIYLLMRAYFAEDCGLLRGRIDRGEVDAVLEAVKVAPVGGGEHPLAGILAEIDQLRACMDSLCEALPRAVADTELLRLRAGLAAQAILRRMDNFGRAIRTFHDRTTKAFGGDGAVGGGKQQAVHCPGTGPGPQDGSCDHSHPGRHPACASPLSAATSPCGARGAAPALPRLCPADAGTAAR